MFTTTISEDVQNNLALLGRCPWLSPFYLAGGTALALHLGHRFSLDLDLFTPEEFNPKDISQNLKTLGKLTIDRDNQGTLLGYLNGVKVSFFHYPYPLVFPTKKYLGVRVADMRDIACMKIDALSTRGTRRDFVDLYFICQKEKLLGLFRIFEKKYKGVHYNLFHLIKSLTYFVDAEGEEMSRMAVPVKWLEVKELFIREVREISQKLLR